MLKVLEKHRKHARKYNRTIVLPESDYLPILRAACSAETQNYANIVLIGNKSTVNNMLRKNNLKFENGLVIDPRDNPLSEVFAKKLYKLRARHGLDLETARAEVKKNPVFALMMLRERQVDGVIGGAHSTTPQFLRPTFQIIPMERGIKKACGIFYIVTKKQGLVFADCAVQVDPSPRDLAEIAVNAACIAKKIGLRPRVAMLSFSTHGSAKNARVAKVQDAVKILRKKKVGFVFDGEIQFDASYVPEVAKRKCKKDVLRGRANVFVFPSLEAANIGYKMMERLAGAKAIGPLLAGLSLPVSDLSRGSGVQDIIDDICNFSYLAKPLFDFAKLKEMYQ